MTYRKLNPVTANVYMILS